MKGGQKPRHFVDISASPTSHLISPSLPSTSRPPHRRSSLLLLNAQSKHAIMPRYLTIIATFAIVLQIFFLYVADNHIFGIGRDSSRRHQAADANDDGWLRRSTTSAIKTTTIRYIPDYSKFNTSFPPVLYASSPGSLSSIPSSHRAPRHLIDAQSFTEYYSKWDNTKDPPSLFVYNPSIVPLVSSTTQTSTDNAVYLASFRVSSIHSCGFPTYEFWKYPADYLGIALLDNTLQVSSLKAYSLDIVVDVNAHLPKIFEGGSLKFQDVRLFIIHDRVYMSSGVYLVPICVTISGVDIQSRSPAICKEDASQMVEIPALFANNDRCLRLFVTGDAIRMKNAEGKNFQFFQNSTLHETTFMEYWPSGPRLVHDLGDAFSRGRNTESKPTKLKVVDFVRREEITIDTVPVPKSDAARSLDGSLRTFIKRDRSSACCISIGKEYYKDFISTFPDAYPLKSLDNILVGISHSKSRQRMPSSQGDRYNYLSRLYAFSSSKPFDLIARSGLFCLGFPRDDDFGVDNDSYYALTKTKRLELNGKTYDCPNIHFVSGITEKVGEDSRMIISYGVNDCVPRFIEIAKRDFVVHLFSK